MKRYPATLLVILATGALSRAPADPPVTPVAPKPQDAAAQDAATQDSTTKDSTTQSSAQTSPSQTAPATTAASGAETPAAAPANPTPSGVDEQMEKQLRAQGYKLTMKNGERLFCRSERPTGSNLPSTHCVTVAEAEARSKAAKENTERIQHSKGGCIGTGNVHVAPNCGD
jgi:hypothetical protein